MISLIKGVVFTKTNNSLFIEAQNIGYEILVGEAKVKKYEKNQKVFFFLCSFLQEKWFEFYGFESLEEKSLFQLLIKVNGLGPKSALNLFNQYDLKTIISAIQNKENILFEKVAGIGKKTAAKISIDLEKKIAKMYSSFVFQKEKSSLTENLFSALKNMGFKDSDILSAIQKTMKTESKKDFSFLFRSCLKQIKK